MDAVVSASFTVTVQVALLSPAVAVIVAVPAATAVTTPPLTVATAEEDVVHTTVTSVDVVGRIVAVRVAVDPTVKERELLLRFTEVTIFVSIVSSSIQEITDRDDTPAKTTISNNTSKNLLLGIKVLVFIFDRFWGSTYLT